MIDIKTLFSPKLNQITCGKYFVLYFYSLAPSDLKTVGRKSDLHLNQNVLSINIQN